MLNSTSLIGAFVLAGLTSLLTQATWQVVVLVLLAALLVLGVTGWVRRNTAPLSWLGRASRWFATTTFLAASGRQAAAWSLWRPRMSWDVTRARAREVAGEILKAQLPGTPDDEKDRAQQFHLQLRTLALLEDLRWAHRSWAPDLRGRKRRVPPVVFVPRADARNGALRVLGAISDVRSRRSEQDPLLVLAAVAHADVAAWLEDAGTAPVTVHAVGSRRRGPYENWVSDLRVRQAPSRGRALAWTLPVRLTRHQLGAARPPASPRCRSAAPGGSCGPAGRCSPSSSSPPAAACCGCSSSATATAGPGCSAPTRTRSGGWTRAAPASASASPPAASPSPATAAASASAAPCPARTPTAPAPPSAWRPWRPRSGARTPGSTPCPTSTTSPSSTRARSPPSRASSPAPSTASRNSPASTSRRSATTPAPATR
ncbi:hypothetical protein ACFQ1I_06840 [Kitasatospora arboriphila]